MLELALQQQVLPSPVLKVNHSVQIQDPRLSNQRAQRRALLVREPELSDYSMLVTTLLQKSVLPAQQCMEWTIVELRNHVVSPQFEEIRPTRLTQFSPANLINH